MPSLPRAGPAGGHGPVSAPHQPAAPDDLVSWAGVQLRHRTVVLLVVGAAAALAFSLRLYLILRPGHLFGIVQYDDAVYVGAAIRIANGALPYRNFVFDQPPGVPLLLAPLGLLSHVIGSRQTMGAATACLIPGRLPRRPAELAHGLP